MKSIPVKFHDKSQLMKLPKIPKYLIDGARDLAATKIDNPQLTLFEKLEAIYAFTDQWNEFVATFAVCQKGCSHCCKFDVNVSQLEAEYISKKGGFELNRSSGRTLENRTSCTFLGDEGTCTIYSTRPFNCRTFHTLDDPKYCIDGIVDHQVYGIASRGYGNDFYAGIGQWLKDLHDQNNLPYRDIRDWFPDLNQSHPASKKSLWNLLVQRFQ